MERITECTENVTTDTETESIPSNENFTLHRDRLGSEGFNMTIHAIRGNDIFSRPE